MTNRDRRLGMALDDAALEMALLDLSVVIVVPPAPDVAAAVGARLRAPEPQWRPRTVAPRFRLRWALLAALLGLLLLAAIAAATGFGLPGLRILFAEPTSSPSISAAPSASAAPASASPAAPSPLPSGSASPAASPTPSGPTPSPSVAPTPARTLSGASLGQPTTLDAARAAVTFRLFVPEPSVVDQSPPSVYLDSSVPQGQVVLIYATTPALPASSSSPIGPSGNRTALLVTESRGTFDEGFLQKMLGPDATLTAVDVAGAHGFWISGNPHEIVVIDATGRPRPETLRDVGDVLVFVREGTLIRIESGLGLARTLEVARSLR